MSLRIVCDRDGCATQADLSRFGDVPGNWVNIAADDGCGVPTVWTRIPQCDADADLIAHAPTDLAALVAEVERLSRRLGMTRDNAADDLAELRDENERLRAVAEAAGELTYCIGNAGSADIDRAALAVDAALDALDAGGDTDA